MLESTIRDAHEVVLFVRRGGWKGSMQGRWVGGEWDCWLGLLVLYGRM